MHGQQFFMLPAVVVQGWPIPVNIEKVSHHTGGHYCFMCIFYHYLFISFFKIQMDAIWAVFLHSVTIWDLTSFYRSYIPWQSFVLVHVIIFIYHTIPFIWAIILTHVNWHHFSIFLIVMKNSYCQWFIVFCLTYIILFIDLCIEGFSSRTTFNDSYLVQFILYQIKMMGKW